MWICAIIVSDDNSLRIETVGMNSALSAFSMYILHVRWVSMPKLMKLVLLILRSGFTIAVYACHLPLPPTNLLKLVGFCMVVWGGASR